LPPLEADIVISPGGYRGLYTVGICHYVKNHFDVKNKSFAGFSSGTFNALFMLINPELQNKYLRLVFTLQQRQVAHLLEDVIHTITTQFEEKDFALDRLNVGVSTVMGLEYFKQFLSLQDALSCCKCSSFVPFVTHNQLFLVYKHQLTLDGGIYYKQLKKIKDDHFLISSTMFGRYDKNLLSGFKKPKCSFYQLYLYGYHDARKNHDVLAKYFLS
jgi:hypothetical protein